MKGPLGEKKFGLHCLFCEIVIKTLLRLLDNPQEGQKAGNRNLRERRDVLNEVTKIFHEKQDGGSPLNPIG